MSARTLTVSGYGQVQAVPDSAVVRLAASSRAESLGAAVDATNSVTSQLNVCAQRFVALSKIASQGFSVWPAYDQNGQPAGFEARHPVVVACESLSVASEMLTAMVTEIGQGFVVDSVGLEVSGSAEFLPQARAAAFADATAKAEQLAGLAGAQLGQIISVVDGGGDVAPRPAMEAVASLKAAVDFIPGEATLTQSVTITWELGSA